MFHTPDFSEAVMEDKEPTPSECIHDGATVTEWDDLFIVDVRFKDCTSGELRTVPIRCQECGKKGIWLGLCDKRNKYRRCIALYLTDQEYKSIMVAGSIRLRKLLDRIYGSACKK